MYSCVCIMCVRMCVWEKGERERYIFLQDSQTAFYYLSSCNQNKIIQTPGWPWHCTEENIMKIWICEMEGDKNTCTLKTVQVLFKEFQGFSYYIRQELERLARLHYSNT